MTSQLTTEEILRFSQCWTQEASLLKAKKHLVHNSEFMTDQSALAFEVTKYFGKLACGKKNKKRGCPC